MEKGYIDVHLLYVYDIPLTPDIDICFFFQKNPFFFLQLVAKLMKNRYRRYRAKVYDRCVSGADDTPTSSATGGGPILLLDNCQRYTT